MFRLLFDGKFNIVNVRLVYTKQIKKVVSCLDQDAKIHL